MAQLERRVVGSLLLLSSLSFLTLGLYTDQLEFVLEIMKKIFETAVLGCLLYTSDAADE